MFSQSANLNPEIVVRGATWHPEPRTEQQMMTTAGTKMLGFVTDPKSGGKIVNQTDLSIFFLGIEYSIHYICFDRFGLFVSVSSSETLLTSCIHTFK